eukprot:5821153-Pyramimonas_sp.AAC.1
MSLSTGSGGSESSTVMGTRSTSAASGVDGKCRTRLGKLTRLDRFIFLSLSCRRSMVDRVLLDVFLVASLVVSHPLPPPPSRPTPPHSSASSFHRSARRS